MEKIMFKSNERGLCPYCNNEDLEYEPIRFDGDSCYFKWTCSNCEGEGWEWYSMDFIGHNAVNENYDEVEVSECLKMKGGKLK